MPHRVERSQLGLDEVLEYCALLDQGAKDVPVKEAWETIVDGSEKSIREMTRAPSCYTLGNALQHEVTPLTAAILQFKATYHAQKAAAATAKKAATPSKKEPGEEGAPGAGGPNGTYSKKQISAMLKQIGASPYGKGKGKAKGKGGGAVNPSSGWYVAGHGDWGYGGWGSPNWGMSWNGGTSTGGGNVAKPSHPCRDFQAGRCQRGDQCRFQHSGGGEK
ncbi:hypothetical protein AB1Y20_020025 [Prymnesium parvum]|uniref:C3H1-type domain-containing protein n=1 Tax=Prymnesium parvum TaxID=97485 RepID=A0AB34JTY4_PRYPA